MPNGKGFPDCSNCRFLASVENRKECEKHKFIIPQISFEKLCNDWQDHKGNSKHHFRSLSHGILYYYSYASNQPPVPLDKFEHFVREVEYFTVDLVEDPEFGWSLYYINANNNSTYELPSELAIQIDELIIQFEVAEASRIFHGGGTRQDDGTWKKHWTKGSRRIIFCPSDPDILYKWLNKYFEVEEILYRFSHIRTDYLLPVRLEILCEPDPVEKKLHIKPFIPMYGQYARRVKRK